MSYANTDVQFLEGNFMKRIGLGGWSLILLIIGIATAVTAVYLMQVGYPCMYNLCAGPLIQESRTPDKSVIMGLLALVFWFSSMIVGVFGTILKSNPVAAGLSLFLSLVPTLYVALEIVHAVLSTMMS